MYVTDIFSGTICPERSGTSFGSDMMSFARVPSTQYPGMTHAFRASWHQRSKSWRDSPLCSIPGLANTTRGCESSRSDIPRMLWMCLKTNGLACEALALMWSFIWLM